MPAHAYTEAERIAVFWSKVTRCDHGTYCLYCCWLWTGDTRRSGQLRYGRITMPRDPLTKKTQHESAHRFSWMLHNQQSLPKHDHYCQIRHLCDVSLCVNPWHLARGTPQQNMDDKVAAGHASSLPGEQNGMASLTEDEVRQIRLLRQQGTPYKKIAEIMHRSSWLYMVDICRYTKWKHIA